MNERISRIIQTWDNIDGAVRWIVETTAGTRIKLDNDPFMKVGDRVVTRLEEPPEDDADD